VTDFMNSYVFCPDYFEEENHLADKTADSGVRRFIVEQLWLIWLQPVFIPITFDHPSHLAGDGVVFHLLS
jgi:hypothetical protein